MKELTQLQYFRVVARVENITKAAEQLHLSQPNLSRAIKRLESDLGIALFDRANGKLRLNKYGRTYLEYVDKAFTALGFGEQKLMEMVSQEHQNHIAIASIVWQIVEAMVMGYEEQYPAHNISFSYNQFSIEAIVNGLWNGNLDFALVQETEPSSNIHWEKAFECPICVLVPKSSPLSKKKTIHLSELKDCKFTCNNAGIGRPITEMLCRNAGFSPEILFESNNGAFAGSWMEKNNCVTLISAYDYFGLIETHPDRTVTAVRIVDPEPVLTLGLATSMDEQQISREAKTSAKMHFYRFALSYLKNQTESVGAKWKSLWENT